MSEEKVEENVEEIKQVSNKFVNSIKNWVAIDDKIRKINNEMKKYKDELKILTSQKQEFEKLVLDELDKMDEKVISISDGKIRKNVSKTQKPLKIYKKQFLNLQKMKKKHSI
jgi:DNA repair ATPase RecN